MTWRDPGREAGPIGGGRQAQLATYSRTVRLMKIALPLGALVLIAAIFLAGRDRGDGSALLTAQELARLGAGMKLDAPRFAGRTDSDEPFIIRAAWAEPDGAVPNEITLEAPNGELIMKDGRTLTGRADKGLMLRDREELTLSGDVVVETSDGYRLETQTLQMELDRRIAKSPGPVRGTGPAGSIEAGAMIMRQSGKEGEKKTNQIWFEKRVRVVFIPDGAR